MRRIVLYLIFLLATYTAADAQHYKKDGTPDMRYKENKQLYGNTYQLQDNQYTAPETNYYPSTNTYSTTPTYTPPANNSNDRNYNNGGQLYMQSGYIKKDGTYVAPHLKTKPDNKQWNNYNNLYK